MAQIKLTKMELRDQQYKLGQLEKYLPTLQLKKAMLQTEVNNALYEIEGLKRAYREEKGKCETFQSLLTDAHAETLYEGAQVETTEKRFENIAGAEIPFFEKVIFKPNSYSLFESPLWIDSAMEQIKELIIAKEKIEVVKEKKRILEKELREVSIRVNLFEKILIPRTQKNIKKIKVFLGDQELASVAQAKVAKSKIMKRKG
ncbi:V-type ATP synthase subunit D [Candidatus Neptunochlamydia vexilliferae]|uniref:V-type ATP synthase subunit D n=1 Tax=Candidatus Neptunichlamydia vexilliferae TaxID=1651774 RepID=A0ABS0AZU1_9BACT|nr:V-type ATP synthase subunit D [Candidatus Neptunochlamydia vexilliferae]MBF5059645.1 V-type ATP synthase subunit D [Candidatus Neptunochlamydia vexilliferae]